MESFLYGTYKSKLLLKAQDLLFHLHEGCGTPLFQGTTPKRYYHQLAVAAPKIDLINVESSMRLISYLNFQ
jgi:hypothetical protein